MDNILLCSNHIPLVTSIHNTFIEKYMLGANGSYVKVYLYLSKCIQSGQDDISISSLADQMENTEKDVLRALNYWEKQGLLTITRSEDKSTILGIDVLNPDTLPAAGSGKKQSVAAPVDARMDLQSVAAPVEPTEAAETASPDESAKLPVKEDFKEDSAGYHSFQVTPQQTKRLTQDDEFCWTCNVVESYLARPMKPGELQLISYLYDNLHFSSELILHLYEYCISLGKTSTRYIQTVAISWNEKEVKTPEDAQNASSTFNASYTAISKAFALGRSLAAVERKYVDHWQNDWKMDLSVILEACNRTMLKLQHGDFKYTEGILDNWQKAGCHTLLDVEKADENYAKKKSQPKQNSSQPIQGYAKNNRSRIVQHGLTKDDADALEKKLLNV
jgi:DnaD/phage-associated family protein